MVYRFLFFFLISYLSLSVTAQFGGRFLPFRTPKWGLHQIDFTSYPFVINARFDDFDVRTNPVTFSLYTKDTFLFGCSNSNYKFDCRYYKSCHQNKSHAIDNVYPFFELKGNDLTTDFIVDQMLHRPQMYAIVSNTCLGTIPHYSMGSIGLGVDGPAFASLPNGPAFVFYIKTDEDDSISATLFFQKESTMVDVNDDHYLVTASNDWHIPIESLTMDMVTVHINSFAILDPNFLYIGIPELAFQKILDDFVQYYDISCIKVHEYYSCLLDEAIENLPDLIIKLDEQEISIGPDEYLKQVTENNYTLLLAPTTSDVASDNSYVTEPYKDDVILGLPFMTNRYFLFELDVDQNPQISIYTVRDTIDDSNLKKYMLVGLLIVSSVVLLVCLTSLIFSARKQSQKKDKLLERIEKTRLRNGVRNVHSPVIHSRFRDTRR